MPGFHLTEEIPRLPLEVFEFIAELGNIPKWHSVVTGVSIEGKGPVKTGMMFSERRLIRGEEGSVDNEVVLYEPPHTFATGFSGRGFRVIYKYTVRSQGTGSIVDLEVSIKGDGIKTLVTFIIARSMKGQDRDLLKRLKAAMHDQKGE